MTIREYAALPRDTQRSRSAHSAAPRPAVTPVVFVAIVASLPRQYARAAGGVNVDNAAGVLIHTRLSPLARHGFHQPTAPFAGARKEKAMRSSLRRTALAAVLSLAGSAAFAQSTGTLSGLVTDESGAAVPGVIVEVSSQDTGQVRTATTGPDGFYAVPLLPPGVYDVKASLAGFASLLRRGVRVSGSETARINLSLKIGPVTENVTVVFDAPLIET